ncbi:MAG: FtsQ-type POTRA domain-containing protein [bacterium]|nr:FtsQ-type POTRA domain-containing protein [bacterium]MDE0290492.1 FtsQ-type POTRA domain-containing protein [bacterium]MDE0439514.1 FtsQ-type POTRA domain-containing protein [bacterium]
MRVDPRIIRRRLEVAEEQARSRVRRSLTLLLAMAGAGCVAWFFASPLMSVRAVVVDGASRSAVDEILSGAKVVEGRPMVAIRVGAIEEHLVADPWIESASVKVVFPTTVEVAVREREPIAWIRLEDQWGLLADGGLLVEYADSPTPIRSLIRIPVEDPGLGAAVENENVSGALQFLGALPEDLARRSVAKVVDEELWVLVGYRSVRIGLPVEMEAKAASLVAMINTAHGGVIDVTAPSRPAIRSLDTAGEVLSDSVDV